MDHTTEGTRVLYSLYSTDMLRALRRAFEHDRDATTVDETRRFCAARIQLIDWVLDRRGESPSPGGV